MKTADLRSRIQTDAEAMRRLRRVWLRRTWERVRKPVRYSDVRRLQERAQRLGIYSPKTCAKDVRRAIVFGWAREFAPRSNAWRHDDLSEWIYAKRMQFIFRQWVTQREGIDHAD